MLKYEKLVKSVYPTAYLLTDKYYDNIVEYIVVFNFFYIGFWASNKSYAWKNAWNKIEKQIKIKLES